MAPDSLGIPATQHIRDTLKLNVEIQSRQDKPFLSVMTVPMVSLSSVWIIDKKYVITGVCGLDENGIMNDFVKYQYFSYRTVLSSVPTIEREAVLSWFGGRDGFLAYHNVGCDDISDNLILE